MQKKSLALVAAFLFTSFGAAHPDNLAHAQSRVSSKPNHQKKAEVRKMDTTPLSCNLAAMTPAQRQQYSKVKTRLRAAVQEVKELPDGYAFRYNADPSLFMEAAEFATLESRCCPFFSFVLEARHNGGPMWLRITGPKEAKPFIKDALAC